MILFPPEFDSQRHALERLRPAFMDGGSVTAGNASGINDGAAALVRRISSVVDAALQAVKVEDAFAALLNSWRPKVHVNFAKPSGHSAIFYAVTQAEGDVKGNMILKALLKRGAEPNVALKQPDAIGWVSSAAGVVLVLEGVPLSCGRSTSWL